MNDLVKPPSEPHLLLYTDAQFQLAMPIPPGAVMGIVDHPTGLDVQHKMILVKVSKREIAFRCICNPNCHAVYRYKLAPVLGRHK